MIADHFLQKSMMMPDMLKEQPGNSSHHGQLIKWTLIARVFVDLFRGLKGLFSLVHV